MPCHVDLSLCILADGPWDYYSPESSVPFHTVPLLHVSFPTACFADGLWDYYSPESSVLSDTRRQMRRLEAVPNVVRSLAPASRSLLARR